MKIPGGWAETTFGEISVPVEQRAPDRSGDFTYVDISSIDRASKRIVNPQRLPGAAAPSRAKQRLQNGDVLVSMTRPNLNAVAVVPDELHGSIGSTGFCVLRAALMQPKFIGYRVQSRDFVEQMSMLVQGALYPAVRPKDIMGFSLLLPPRGEQDRIVAEIEKQFTRLDNAVAALKRVQANLKRYRASVLKAACEGRLVPTEAELARKEKREYEPASELLLRILAQRQAEQKEPKPPNVAGLPPLPRGWTWATLDQLSRLQSGIQKQPSRAPRNNAHPYLRVANVYRGRLDLAEIEQMELFGGELAKLRLVTGDLLIVEGNGSPSEVGRMAIWQGDIEDCVHQNHIIRARLFPEIEPAYCMAYWNSPHGVSQVMKVSSSTSGLYTLSVGKVGQIAVPLPPAAEQRRIVLEVERCLSALDDIEATLSTRLRSSQGLRQAVLRNAFQGGLVDQDLRDEPASLLLERIREDRKSLDSAPRKTRTKRGPVMAEAL